MKKSVLILLSVLTLAACSEDKLAPSNTRTVWVTPATAYEIATGIKAYEAIELIQAVDSVQLYHLTDHYKKFGVVRKHKYSLSNSTLSIYISGAIEYEFTDKETLVRKGLPEGSSYRIYKRKDVVIVE